LTIVTPRQEISKALGNFDRRTLELLLSKLDKAPPPSHLSDLRIVQLMETHGRERRWRYFTFASYRDIIANEKLDDQDGPYASVDFSNVGNFAPFVAGDFYADIAELSRITDYAFTKSGKVEDVGEDAALKRVKKLATPSSGLTGRGNKRKRGEAGLDVDADGEVGRTPRKRGRPRKHPVESQHDATDATGKAATPTGDNGHRRQNGPGEDLEAIQEGATSTANDHHSPSPGVLRKRHHPPDDSVVPEASKPKKRGRPRKRPPSPPPVDELVVHPSPQKDIYPFNVQVARRPLPEPPPNADTNAAEAQHINHAEVSPQPEHTSTVPPGSFSLGAPSMATGPTITTTMRMQGRTETAGELDTDGGIARMDTSSDPAVLVDYTMTNASSRPQDSCKAATVERADSVLGKVFLVVQCGAKRI
jgi:oxalate---CoA ligase